MSKRTEADVLRAGIKYLEEKLAAPYPASPYAITPHPYVIQIARDGWMRQLVLVRGRLAELENE